jgi:hypothetical protein
MQQVFLRAVVVFYLSMARCRAGHRGRAMALSGVLYALVWLWWIERARRRVLFVYSDSPNWKEYVEPNILPKLPASTVVLNWSNRTQWPTFSLPVMLFTAFGGDREFNPIGLVFDRLDVVEPYRFWQ